MPWSVWFAVGQCCCFLQKSDAEVVSRRVEDADLLLGLLLPFSRSDCAACRGKAEHQDESRE